jgi:hypothetical protein
MSDQLFPDAVRLMLPLAFRDARRRLLRDKKAELAERRKRVAARASPMPARCR